MAVEPVRFLDGLVKELILSAYDFARLTVAGIVLPFVRRTSRFWPGVMAANRRLSSLTYLVFWIVLAAAFSLGTGAKLASGLAGLDKAPDTTVAGTIATALLLAMIIDVLIRASAFLIRIPIRREIYENIARISIANIFLGACIIVALGPRPGELLSGPFLLTSGSYGTGWTLFIMPSPFLMLCAFSFATLAAKALKAKDWIARIAIGLVVILCLPTLLLNISYRTVLMIGRAQQLIAPDIPKLAQTNTTCRSTSDQIEVSGFLSLRGQDSFPVRPQDFAVKYMSDGRDFRGTMVEGQPLIVVSRSTYTAFKMLAAYDPMDRAKAVVPGGDCSLVLLSPVYRPLDDDIPSESP